ncbi:MULTISPECIES: glutathione S-transferase family protein [unclassified Beijerinckia]|uniref:glutathione S-transferase family protein n=1 Tax=unclassified Beijerinckia TaxID=2638183 RepID=UPI00089C095E|nr:MULTISPECIES: glutathione S-transferase family protein [unclassified Beijerinckia]MDH7798926.1 GST-like protein [Beijerinckia sp. GAS462]SED86800.1 GST-like protein [Beijerinckia sp. 28-YEA-48]
MIDLYYAPTGNGYRACIILREAELEFRPHRIHFTAKPEELFKLNPSGTIPVIRDSEGLDGRPLVLSQSGAILEYVALKTGRFWPADLGRRAMALQWFAHALSDVSASSSAFHMSQNDVPERSEANTRFWEQWLLNMLGACDRQLEGRDYLAEEVSLADFALYPAVMRRLGVIERHGGMVHLNRWLERMSARPGVAAGMAMK